MSKDSKAYNRSEPASGVAGVKLTSYAQFQAYLTSILTMNISVVTQRSEEFDSEHRAPHGAFWNTLTYDQFVNGTVPGVTDCNTGGQVTILVKGNSSQSQIIQALEGAAGTCYDPVTGGIGRMPADGPPFLTAEQIKPIADWIDAGCPEFDEGSQLENKTDY